MLKAAQRTCLAAALSTSVAGCGGFSSYVSHAGPDRAEIEALAPAPDASRGEVAALHLIDVTDEVVRRLGRLRQQQLFSEVIDDQSLPPLTVGIGDLIQISIWEAPPAALFGSAGIEARTPGLSAGTARSTVIPEAMIGSDGTFNVPFAGSIKADGQSLQQIEQDIAQRLKGKANQPQVQARVVGSASTTITVVGEVAQSTRMPLTPRRERLLDALASAGGVRHPVDKVSLQLTRGSHVQSLPLDTIIRDPRQNIRLRPGDVVTALHQPLSFTALGALSKNEEVPFEGQGISLTQALARVGGLQDQRADARNVLVFRMEDQGAINLTRSAQADVNGRVPVIYRINLRDPRSFFLAQGFAIQHRDLVYVGNAPAADLQKFVNLIAGVGYPLLGLATVSK